MNFHGIIIDEEIRFPKDNTDLCWDGIAYVCEWIKRHTEFNEINKQEYDDAKSSVERYFSWKNGIGRRALTMSSKTINETIGPAIRFVIKYDQ